MTLQTSKVIDVKELTQPLPKLLMDILKEPVKYNPQLLATSSKTTDVFASKSKETRQALAIVAPKLTLIIPCRNLVRQLVPELTVEDIWVHPGDRLSIRVDSRYTKASLTRAIYSEKDSEDIFLGLYLYPALALLGFLQAKANLEKGNSLKKYTNDEIMDYKELEDDTFRLYAASFGGAAHIADLGVYELCSDDQTSDLHLLTEVKTPVAFPEALLRQVSPKISPETGLGAMKEADMDKIEGWAIEFKWPRLDQNFGNRDSMEHNKVISQVWNQMIENDESFAILTCGGISYCFYRKDLKSGHLYISPPCYSQKDGVMDIVIWTLKAAGYLQGDVNVPEVVSDWWKQVPKSKQPGINQWTLPSEALRHKLSKKQTTP